MAQELTTNYRYKRIAVRDTIQIDSVSINPAHFVLRNRTGQTIDTARYRVDFATARLFIEGTDLLSQDSLDISYLNYPEYLTRAYRGLDPNLIVNSTNDRNIYSLAPPPKKDVGLFDGLTATGSITRGVTIGNNQNAVVNSQLDLQMSGKISDKVTLRASIVDANIPLQESGYSQRLDEFDQVFIELQSEHWNIRAGDVNLQNADSYFMRFTKKVQGLSIGVNLPGENATTELFGAGALVRGRFAQSRFTGQEGNQGPYKLLGNNDELFILIISGSDRVYVNGLPVERGENRDYIIDYNAGEIIFNSTYPITRDMRITIDYQYTDNNYTRFVAYGGGQYKSKTFRIGGYVYSESDAKNQPVQQDLTEEQVQILQEAGDDRSKMIAPSAVPDTFSENKILYRKDMADGQEIFVFSNNPDDELFSVRFSFVGAGMGDYVISDTAAIGRIFEYVSSIDGVSQGDHAPVIQLAAPTKLQMAVVNGGYTPTEKTHIDFEMAFSNNDLNLFSDIDNEDNEGLAGKINLRQRLYDKKWRLDAYADYDFVGADFRNLEGLYQIEFNRDWNLPNQGTNIRENLNGELGDQNFLRSGLAFQNPEKGDARYAFERLTYGDSIEGTRHLFDAGLKLKDWRILVNTSLLNNDTSISTSDFLRAMARATYSLKKGWVGGGVALEDIEEVDKETKEFSPISQRFKQYSVFGGIGDSTQVFVEVGYRYRENDSVRNDLLQKVNTSNTVFLNMRPLKGKSAQLRIFASYRDMDFEDPEMENERSINSRILYNQRLWDRLVLFDLAYETNAGTLAQQDFTYVQVDPGQGVYVWIDYNENGIQELNEFEIAEFQDQAEYIRVLLPNRIFVPTYQTKFSFNLTLNPTQWVNDKKWKKFFSHFYDQASYLIDRKVRREGDVFEIDPFANSDEEKLLGLTQSVRNTLFFNRGKQRYTTSYTFLNTIGRNLLSTGLQENSIVSHQLQFVHKIQESWLLNFLGSLSRNESLSQNFPNRNFTIETLRLNPKVSYLIDLNSRFDLFYDFQDKENTLGGMETLDQHRLGASFSYASKQKLSFTGEFSYIDNTFEGNAFSPVGYQMLEGLQPGSNFTWGVLGQIQLLKFLDLNLIYQGRKSNTSDAVHTGSAQLRAYF